RIARIDVDTGIAVGDGGAVVPASWHSTSSAGLPTFAPRCKKYARHSRDRARPVGSGAPSAVDAVEGGILGMAIAGKSSRLGRKRDRKPVVWALLVALVIFGGRVAEAAVPAEDAVFTVCNYPVEARADNAVAAKSKALSDGQQAAFRSLLKRLVPVNSYPRL